MAAPLEIAESLLYLDKKVEFVRGDLHDFLLLFNQRAHTFTTFMKMLH